MYMTEIKAFLFLGLTFAIDVFWSNEDIVLQYASLFLRAIGVS